MLNDVYLLAEIQEMCEKILNQKTGQTNEYVSAEGEAVYIQLGQKSLASIIIGLIKRAGL